MRNINIFKGLPLLKFSVFLSFSVITLTGCSLTSDNNSAFSEVDPSSETLIQPRADVPALTGSITLNELVSYAQAYHPQVQAVNESARAAKARVTAAGTWSDPQLSVSQGLNDSNWQTLSIEQEIPTFGRRHLGIEQAKSAWEAAKAQRNQVQADVMVSVLQAWAEYAFILKNQQILDDQRALLSQMVAVVDSRYRNGQSPVNQLLRTQNELDQVQSELRNLEQLKTSAIVRLNSAIGRPAMAQLPELPELDEGAHAYSELPASVNELHQLAETYNPSLGTARHQVEALHHSRELANKAGLPRLMVGAEYMDTAMASGTVTGMASVSLPIWRSGYRAQREAADAELNAEMQRYHSLELDVSAELSMAVYGWQEAKRNEQLFGDVLITRAEQAIDSAFSAYQTSTGDYTNLIESQREWLAFSLNYNRALANLVSNAAVILNLTGLSGDGRQADVSEVSHD